ncbi:MAG TPA: thiol peroxidase [Flavobacteriales bacterium]|nr:thiol peroxidase [Flavobacteriales bacterium]
MATTNFKGSPVKLQGELPSVGSTVPNLRFVKDDLSEADLASLRGNVVVLFAMPSVDTGICALETKAFNQKVDGLGAMAVAISEDLPFAMKRFCAAEGIANVVVASDFRYHDMSEKFGVRMLEGPLAGLHARVVFVLDKEGVLRYTQLVPDITQEPDYEAVLDAVKKLL